MAWPDPSVNSADALDSPLDDPVNALPILYDTVTAVQAIIAARGAANGVCDLGADGKVPAARLAALEDYVNPVLLALGGVAAASDKLPYFIGSETASVCDLTSFARTVLAAADAAAARTALGAALGSDVQAYSAELDGITTAGIVAETAAIGAGDEPVPLAGYLHRGADSVWAVVPLTEVNAALIDEKIALALAGFAVDRELDDLMTATEAFLSFLPALTPGELRNYLQDVTALAAIWWDVPFLNTSYAPLVGGAVGTGGNIAVATGEAGHIGCVDFRSGTASGAGYKVYGHSKMALLKGGERLRAIVKTPASFSTVSTLIGFTGAGGVAEPTAGLYFWFSGSGVCTPKAVSGSTTASGSSYTLSASTWYTFRIAVNAAATAVLFEILDDTGAVLSASTLTTNIPTTATNEVGPSLGAISTDTSGTLVLLTADHFDGYLPV